LLDVYSGIHTLHDLLFCQHYFCTLASYHYVTFSCNYSTRMKPECDMNHMHTLLQMLNCHC